MYSSTISAVFTPRILKKGSAKKFHAKKFHLVLFPVITYTRAVYTVLMSCLYRGWRFLLNRFHYKNLGRRGFLHFLPKRRDYYDDFRIYRADVFTYSCYWHHLKTDFIYRISYKRKRPLILFHKL